MSLIYQTTGNIDNKQVLKGVNLYDTKSEIKIYNISKKLNKLDSYILAGNIHKHVRKIVQPMIEPGMKLSKIANLIESTTKQLTNNVGINYGIGFPTGLSLNKCAAHYSPYQDNDKVFGIDDILKIDYGVEVNGFIIDSAFTVYFNEKYDILTNAVKEATNTGIKNLGVDVIINEWAQDIYEVMTSYEINNKPINPIVHLGGHNILRRIIHGGVFLPSKPVIYYSENDRFKEGVYAVETFGSTGTGNIETIYGENSLYMLKKVNASTKNKKLNSVIKKLYKSFNTLPFSSRYLTYPKLKNISKESLDKLAKLNILSSYPPLVDNSGYTAQYEHTIFLEDGKKINLSKDVDY